MIRNLIKFIAEWVTSFCIAFSVVFVFKTLVGMPTTVKGTSMSTTLYPEDKLFLSTWSASVEKLPKRGSIITFEAPNVEEADSSFSTIAIYKKDSRSFFQNILYYGLGVSKSSYIKRVIGLPGDHIEIKNGHVYINGTKYDEDYLSSTVETDMSLGGEFDDVVVPKDCVFVLGDNRTASVDSRKFGCIPLSRIEGKVVARWWPTKKWALFKAEEV